MHFSSVSGKNKRRQMSVLKTVAHRMWVIDALKDLFKLVEAFEWRSWACLPRHFVSFGNQVRRHSSNSSALLHIKKSAIGMLKVLES
jgi:hypothetical protein